MSRKFACLVVLIFMSLGASAQMEQIDSIVASYDTVSTIPDTLLSKIDTANKTLVGQTKSTDTVVKKTDSTAKTTQAAPVQKFDRRWFISPLLKFQAQEFGMLERQRRHFESNAHLLPFTSKSTISAAASVYKNFTKNISMSADVGASMGHVTSKDILIGTTKKQTYVLMNATLYYHLLGGQYKLQPFVAAGINNVLNKTSYITAPVGAGVKFTGKKLMVEAQGAYGYALSTNIANTLVYSLGVYIPIKSKKQKEKEAGKSDTATINITNITNNYYLLNNQDSLKKAQEDSIAKKSIEDKLAEEAALAELDPDDPMRLPAAKKFIVYFYYDQYALTSSAFGTIDQVITRLKENKNLNVHLKGHTDQSGSEQYNAPLSKKRAQMVFDYLNSRGIAPERIVLSGFGKKSPAVANENPNTAWLNRRCELVLFEKK